MNHIIQINNNFAACVQSVRHQHTHMISECRATGQSQPRQHSVQSRPKFASSIFAGHRCDKSLFRTRIVAHHPKFYNLRVHLMQFSLVILRCNITFSLFRLSQGSVATLILPICLNVVRFYNETALIIVYYIYICKKTYQFKTLCQKPNHTSKTAKIIL